MRLAQVEEHCVDLALVEPAGNVLVVQRHIGQQPSASRLSRAMSNESCRVS